jgi:uncharacterized membrane protein
MSFIHRFLMKEYKIVFVHFHQYQSINQFIQLSYISLGLCPLFSSISPDTLHIITVSDL